MMTDSLLIYLICTNCEVKLYLICGTDRTILGSQDSYKKHKLTNNWLSNFGLIEELRHLSGILTAIIAETLDLALASLIFLARVNVLCKDIKKLQGQCA